MNAVPEIWLTLETAAVVLNCEVRPLRRACAQGLMPSRYLESNGQGEPRQRVVRLRDAHNWFHEINLTGKHSKTLRLFAMIREGASVDGMMQELGMERGAVLRQWQRECKRNPDFPRRDPRTDRAVGAPEISVANVVAKLDEKSGRDREGREPSFVALRDKLLACQTQHRLQNPSRLLQAFRK